jgi:hypothetical protein
MSDKHQQAGSVADAWNIEEVGCSDPNDPIREYSKLSPWPYTDGDYLYSGGYVPHRCFMVVDLRDRTKPKPIAIVYPYDPVKSPPPPPGDPRWSEKTPIPGWDPGWNTHTHYVFYHSDILVVNQERYRYGTPHQDHYRGIKVYDVSDRHNPKFLSYFVMPGNGSGVHHFFFDGRYVYLGGEYEGFTGKILVIVDLKNPHKPVEVGKWWVPGQKNNEEAMRDWIQTPLPFAYVTWGQTASGKWLPQKHLGLHYVTVHENRAYLAYHQGGFIILNISDKSKPQFISRLDYHFPPQPPEVNPDSKHAGNSHSAKLVPGRKLIALSDEFNLCPFGWMRFVDISDEKKPKIISEFKYPENTCPGFNAAGNGPSTHIGNAWNENLLFQAWYKLGLRVIDIKDPYHPVEVGHYVGPDIGQWSGADMGPPGGKLVLEYRKYVDTYDVVFGRDGLLYVSDAAGGGLRVLRYTGPGMHSIQDTAQDKK